MSSPVTPSNESSFIWFHMSTWPPATQAFIVALSILAFMSLTLGCIASFGPDKSSEALKPIISGGIDLIKVLVGAFAGSLTGKGKT